MIFLRIRSIFIGILIMICSLVAIHAQALIPSNDHAKEILDRAREAIGGKAALDSIQSLSAIGEYRNDSGLSGDIHLSILAPDKIMIIVKLPSLMGLAVTNTEAMNGGNVWTDSTTDEFSQTSSGGMASGGGMRPGGGPPIGGGPPPGIGSDSGGPPSTVEKHASAKAEETNIDSRQIRLDLSSLLFALMLHVPDSYRVEISSGSDVATNNTRADFLKIFIDSGLEIILAIDQKTHLPITVAYNLLIEAKAETEETKSLSPKPERTHIQIYFSGYRAVVRKGRGNILMPYQITKTQNGQYIEDMYVKKYRLNKHFNPKQFRLYRKH
jgi:hypothetical protein